MEIIIIIGLLIIIILLRHEKIVLNKYFPPKKERQIIAKKTYDIIGEAKTLASHLVPTSSLQGKNHKLQFDPSKLDIEYDANENVNVQNPQEEPGKVFNSEQNFTEEEEEWNKYKIIDEDNGFAQGVTFEELSAVKMILQNEICDTSQTQKETAVALVQKIYGTDLYTLLENSMETASHKITELLDNSFNNAEENGSSDVRKNDVNNFDIQEFI